jgi:hypothetical protein
MKIITRNIVRLSFALLVTVSIAAMTGCEPKPAPTPTPTPGSSPSPTAKTSKSGATGTITVDPNPVKVCDGTGLGIVNVNWTFSGAQKVEIHVGAPTGVMLSMAGAPGTQATGKWVGNGTVFYLQDVSNGLAPSPDYTIASVTANVTTQGCP